MLAVVVINAGKEKRKKSQSISATRAVDIAIMLVTLLLMDNPFAISVLQLSNRWIVILIFV